MGTNAEEFLNSFNRIEKWLRTEMNNPASMGFSEMVRRLSKRKDALVGKNEDDLLQLAQLRNAIVHEKISEDFVIADPNDWAVKRIKEIEAELEKPETVLPLFGKKVTGFEKDLPLSEILKTVAKKRYSQFPLYDHGKFEGLITLRVIGYWCAQMSLENGGVIDLKNKKAEDMLFADGKTTNYYFVAGDTPVYEVEGMFREKANLEAVLITKDGNPDGNLLGIIRPRDIFNMEEAEN